MLVNSCMKLDELKWANQIFWQVKGHLIPDSWSDAEIRKVEESYFKRLWGNHEACYRTSGFEEAWDSRHDHK